MEEEEDCRRHAKGRPPHAGRGAAAFERTSEGREEEKRKRDILRSVRKEKQKLGIYLSARMQMRS
jgi:hypothetical protein